MRFEEEGEGEGNLRRREERAGVVEWRWVVGAAKECILSFFLCFLREEKKQRK